MAELPGLVTDPLILRRLEEEQKPLPINAVQNPELLAKLESEVVPDVESVEQKPSLAKDVLSSFVGLYSNQIADAETAFSVISGAAGEIFGGLTGLAGMVATGGDVRKAVDSLEEVRQIMSYEPNSQQAIRQLEALGIVAEPFATAFNHVSQSLGDWAFDTTNSPEAAAAAYSFPTLVSELGGLGIASRVAKKLPSRVRLRNAQALMLKDPVFKYSGDVAGVRLNTKGDVVPDPMGEYLLDIGMQPNSVSVITNSTPETKALMARMLERFNAGRSNDIIALTNRMSDVIGASITRRLGSLQQRRRTLGSELDSLVNNNLSDVTINVNESVGGFLSALNKDFGVRPRISGSGEITLGEIAGTPLATQSLSGIRRLVQDTLTLVNQQSRNGVMNAADAHQLKKVLDDLVDAERASEAGLSDRTHARLLQLRSGINEALRNASPEYATINDNLSSIINTMSPFDKYLEVGQRWDDAKVRDVVGASMQRFTSRSEGAAGLRQDIAQLEAGLSEAGISFADDTRALVSFADTVENYFQFDLNALSKRANSLNSAISSGVLDAGASLAVGNTFGLVHDLAKLRRIGVSEREARKLLNQRIEAMNTLTSYLNESAPRPPLRSAGNQ